MSSTSKSMRVSVAESRTPKKNAVLAIVVRAFIGGTVNILWVCMKDGWDIPIYITARLVGKQALQGGAVCGSWAWPSTSSSHAFGPRSITWPAVNFHSSPIIRVSAV